MRPLPKVVLAITWSLAAVLMSTSSAFAADSAVTVKLTLKGPVSPDVGFSFTTLPGVGGDSFCVSKQERDEGIKEDTAHEFPFPVCASGTTYTRTVTVANGEPVGYDISIYWPNTARTIWSEDLAADGRNHVRSYVFDFSLPETDSVALPEAAAARGSGWPLTPPLMLAVAGAIGWLVWSERRRRDEAV
ncbi:MAG: hypothetical protein ACJ761_11540 [Chloroflexota bacterium]